jgi:tetratricopeptide (TPR) repeat protein
MDLSRLKWPVIILVVVGIGWLLSSAGVDYMYRQFTSDQPGVDAERDKVNEAGLSKLGGYLLMTLRYDQAYKVFRTAIERYPQGKNRYYNLYRSAKCAEKMGRYQESVNVLTDMMNRDVHAMDERVPGYEVLKLRTDKLIEVHDLRRR